MLKEGAPNEVAPFNEVTWLSLGGVSATQSTSCFFCEENTLLVHQVSTFILNKAMCSWHCTKKKEVFH